MVSRTYITIYCGIVTFREILIAFGVTWRLPGGRTLFISKIRIQNVKGKENWSHTFDGLCSGRVNLFVAPNGYGKSTIATAFRAAAHGRMNLEKGDLYHGDEANVPSLEMTYTEDGVTRTVVSDNVRGEISKCFTVFTISSPLYAKPTGRSMRGFATHSAELHVRDVKVCDVSEKAVVAYSIAKNRKRFGKDAPNIGQFLISEEGLRFVVDNKAALKKCADEKRIQRLLDKVPSRETDAVALRNQGTVCQLMDSLSAQFDLADEVSAWYLVQIVAAIKEQGVEAFKKALSWVTFTKRKSLVNERLTEFDTAGLGLHAEQHKGKLVIAFGRAGRMSNGERDVLTFVASLIAFEARLVNKPGILVIDEVFDYLDGANLLAVQYYLSRMMREVKASERTVIPIIMTHLDPAVFVNYSLKGMSVHYLTGRSGIDLNDNIAKMLLLRSELKGQGESNDYEKYLLHYHPDNWTVPEDIVKRLPDGFFPNSKSLRDWLYKEVEEEYLVGSSYNALAVILALRMKVEEKTVQLLPEDKKAGYYEQHGSNKKLGYAEDCGTDLPELFWLLQPLYNDPAHLRMGRSSDRENRNKIESAYLKVSSSTVRMMIEEVFRM